MITDAVPQLPSSISQVVQVVTLVASAAAAVVAWVVKLRMSDEFARAKEEVVKAKEAQIQFLERELARVESFPKRLEDFYKSTLDEYAKIHDKLKSDLDLKTQELELKNAAIAELLKKNTALSDKDRQLLQDRAELRREVDSIKQEAEILDPSLDTLVSKKGQSLAQTLAQVGGSPVARWAFAALGPLLLKVLVAAALE